MLRDLRSRLTRPPPEALIEVQGVGKGFTLHGQGGARIDVLERARLRARPGRCVALGGPSGAGKSTLMRLIWGSYRLESGSIRIRHEGEWIELATASPYEILEIRRVTLGYVSQSLRAIPRVSALAVVAEPLLATGATPAAAEAQAAALLERLRIPQRLWRLSPTTFSGGERQRVNLARGFGHPFPALLLDEPTAGLDPANRATVIEMIDEAKQRGAAVVAIFHDQNAQTALADEVLDVSAFAAAAAAAAR